MTYDTRPRPRPHAGLSEPEPWQADRHARGWAVYRQGGGAREVYRLPADRHPMIFDQQRAAAVWAEILNERADARR